MIAWTEEENKALGRVPDTAIARKKKCCTDSVARQRQRLGIMAFKGFQIRQQPLCLSSKQWSRLCAGVKIWARRAMQSDATMNVVDLYCEIRRLYSYKLTRLLTMSTLVQGLRVAGYTIEGDVDGVVMGRLNQWDARKVLVTRPSGEEGYE